MESCSAETLLRDARWLRRLTRELVHDPAFADDLCQETMVAALRSPTGGSRHWLTQVARNLAISFLRRDKRRQRAERTAGSDRVEAATSEVVAEGELQQAAVDAVMELREPYRATLLLRFMKGLSLREVGLRMDVPVETVRTRQKRALAQVRTRLDQRIGRSRILMIAPAIPGWAHLSTPALWGCVLMKIKASVACAALLLFALWFGVFGFGGDGRAEEDPNRDVMPPQRNGEQVGAADATALERPKDQVREILTPGVRTENATAKTAAETGGLLVRVTWQDTGEPAAGVSVQLWNSSRSVGVSLTATDGTVRWSKLDPDRGTWSVLIDRVWGQKLARLEAGELTTLAVAVPEGHDVHGVVVDSAGRPVPDATVISLFPLFRLQIVHALTTTGTDGRFFLRAMHKAVALGARNAGHGVSDLVTLSGLPQNSDASVSVRLVLPGHPATLHGRVFDDKNRPVAGANVQIGDPNDTAKVLPPPPVYLITDREGRFSTSMLRTGSHPVRVFAKGFAPWRDKVRCDPAAPAEVTCRLTEGATLIGRVLDEQNRPVASIEARNLKEALAERRTSTGTDGRFSFTHLAAGSFEVTLGGWKRAGRFKVDIPAAGTVHHDFHLGPAKRSIQGVLVDERGKPLVSWFVYPIYSPTPNTTNWKGRFKTRAGPFLIRQQGTKAPIAIARFEKEQEVYRILDAWLPSVVVRGRVLSASGRPLRGVGIWARREIDYRSYVVAEADADGRFTTSRLPPGKYSITARHPTHKSHSWKNVVLSQDETKALEGVVLKAR